MILSSNWIGNGLLKVQCKYLPVFTGRFVAGTLHSGRKTLPEPNFDQVMYKSEEALSAFSLRDGSGELQPVMRLGAGA